MSNAGRKTESNAKKNSKFEGKTTFQGHMTPSDDRTSRRKHFLLTKVSIRDDTRVEKFVPKLFCSLTRYLHRIT